MIKKNGSNKKTDNVSITFIDKDEYILLLMKIRSIRRHRSVAAIRRSNVTLSKTKWKQRLRYLQPLV